MKKTLCDVIILQIALSEVSILIYGYWTIGTRSGCIMNISSQNSLSTLLFWTALMGKLNPPDNFFPVRRISKMFVSLQMTFENIVKGFGAPAYICYYIISLAPRDYHRYQQFN